MTAFLHAETAACVSTPAAFCAAHFSSTFKWRLVQQLSIDVAFTHFLIFCRIALQKGDFFIFESSKIDNRQSDLVCGTGTI
jgi:hypothetical protein